MVLSRHVYDKIQFNVTIWKYLTREQKILEINNSGFFVIYKKGKLRYGRISIFLYYFYIKSDNFLSYLVQDILNIEGEPTTNSLNIVTLFKDMKKSVFIEFSKSYE
jgi:hypothetical protein